jgi:alpha-beta hydrolase superfamily lysophospholipase
VEDAERTPLQRLGVIASQEVELAPGLSHIEAYTLGGLLTVLWHGPAEPKAAVVAGGGAMGGLLGPADGFYHWLGTELAAEGIATLRVGWRQPNDLAACTLDLAGATEMVCRRGAQSVVTMGHSFGGAIAVRVAVAIPAVVAGVVTFATQSAGCEHAEGLGGRPFLLFHGDADEILPPSSSEMVRLMAGSGDLVILPGTGHLLSQAADDLRRITPVWIKDVLGGRSPAPVGPLGSSPV